MFAGLNAGFWMPVRTRYGCLDVTTYHDLSLGLKFRFRTNNESGNVAKYLVFMFILFNHKDA
jgi:hypothetical protein